MVQVLYNAVSSFLLSGVRNWIEDSQTSTLQRFPLALQSKPAQLKKSWLMAPGWAKLSTKGNNWNSETMRNWDLWLSIVGHFWVARQKRLTAIDAADVPQFMWVTQSAGCCCGQFLLDRSTGRCVVQPVFDMFYHVKNYPCPIRLTPEPNLFSRRSGWSPKIWDR